MPRHPRPEPLPHHLLSPQYWPTWILLGAWAALSRLPRPWLMRLGDMLGNLTRRIARGRVRIARINIQRCFPDRDPAWQEALVDANCRAVGRALMEIGIAWWGKPETVAQYCRISGVEHLQAARDQGRGVLLLVSHFTPLEIAAQIFGRHWPHSSLMYKDYDNPVFEWVSRRKRLRYIDKLLPHKQVGTFLQSIREGNTGIYMTDQHPPRKHAVFAPFFGIQTSTLKTTGDFLRSTGAVAVPTFFGRLADDSGYYVEIQPPLENFPGDDPVTDATRLNQLTEQAIMRHPEQYLWQHRRFKHRPEGEASFY